MSLYDGGELFGEKQYQDLASLPLPGPAVVIDVRHSALYGPQLLQNLAIETEDLATEMQLHKVYRWRNLAQWIDFLKLDPLPPSTTRSASTTFWLTPRTGEKKQSFTNPEELAAHLVGRYLDRVRNNRIRALKDRGRDTVEGSSGNTSPEQSTVRIFFLVDMASENSLASAAFYADVIKRWTYQYDDPGRAGRDKRLHNIAICMNVDSRRQHLFTQYQPQTPTLYSIFDAVILMRTYSDDEASIDEDTQRRQLELMLSTLLLYWPDNITSNGWHMQEEQDVSTFLTNTTDIEQIDIETQVLPWPTYIIGVSSLEYTARWGKRYMDYGLAAKLIEILNNKQEVQREETYIRLGVQSWLTRWWQLCQDTVPDSLATSIPDLQALDELHQLSSVPPLQRSPLNSSLQKLDEFRQQVGQLYSGVDEVALERAIIAAEAIPGRLKEFYTQKQADESRSGDHANADEQYARLSDVYTRLERFLETLFKKARGSLPRAHLQISALNDGVNKLIIEEVAKTPVDLEEFHREFEENAQITKKQIEKLLRVWQLPLLGQVFPSTVVSLLIGLAIGITLWFGLDRFTILSHMLTFPLLPNFSFLPGLILSLIVIYEIIYFTIRNKALRSQRDAICQKLSTTLQAHETAIHLAIAADVALTLLEWADLHSPEGKSPYQQRLKTLEKALNDAQAEAIRQNEIAQERLRPSTSKTSINDMQKSTWSNFTGSRNLFPVNQVVHTFWQTCRELDTDPEPEPLKMLAEMEVRQLGKEAPLAITQDLLKKQQVQPQQISDIKRFEAVTIMLVVILISLNISNPDIKQILPLLDQFMRLKQRFAQEPSMLQSIIEDLQNILNDAMKDQALSNNAMLTPNYYRRIEKLLASWIDTVYTNGSALRDVFEYQGIITILEQYKLGRTEIIEDLRERGVLSGYRDETTLDDRYYLLTPPSEIENFQEALEELGASHIRPVGFPDPEKLIYLHVHRIRQIFSAPSFLRPFRQ